MFCSALCSNCRGQSCSNVPSITDDNAFDMSEDIPDPPDFLEQCTGLQQPEEEEDENPTQEMEFADD